MCDHIINLDVKEEKKMKEKITFKNIAGYKEEKEEVKKIIKVLNNYEEYKEKGVKLPKGILLYGEPGSGKTLFSKAIINEANVKTYVFKTSLFLNGVRLRKIFKKARKHIPCIIFIDELERFIDCGFFSSDSSRSALSVLLTELDGYKSSNGVMLLSTTTNRDNLDEALLRPGRIDVQISISNPNRYNRKKIIEYYIKESNLINKVDIDSLSSKTVGFNGADLATLVSQTCLKNIVSNKETLELDDFYDTLNNIRFKDIKHNIIDASREITSIHELGHLIVARELKNLKADVTIESYGESLGSTCYEEAISNVIIDDNNGYDDEDGEENSEERTSYSFSQEDCINNLKIILGGRAAEEVIFHHLYTGSASDVSHAAYLCARLLDSGLFGLEYVDCDYFSSTSNTYINK